MWMLEGTPCVTIPDVSLPLWGNFQKKIAELMHEPRVQIKESWLGNTFGKTGWVFSGWITKLIKILITTITCNFVVCIAITCVKRFIVKSVSQVRISPRN